VGSPGGARRADPDLRNDFVRSQTREALPHELQSGTEYRFAACGFKLWNSGSKLFVSYYAEFQSPERDAIKRKLNTLLANLQREVALDRLWLYVQRNDMQRRDVLNMLGEEVLLDTLERLVDNLEAQEHLETEEA
jgi:hypothetical protein